MCTCVKSWYLYMYKIISRIMKAMFFCMCIQYTVCLLSIICYIFVRIKYYVYNMKSMWCIMYTQNGSTPLLVAAGEGHLEVVEYLVLSGADINENDKVWMHVCVHGMYIFVHVYVYTCLCMMYIWHVNDTSCVCIMYTQGGWTPLFAAAFKGRLDILKYLVSKGGNVNTKDKVWIYTSVQVLIYLFLFMHISCVVVYPIFIILYVHFICVFILYAHTGWMECGICSCFWTASWSRGFSCIGRRRWHI